MGIGRHLPSLSVPRMIDKMRQDTRRVIIPGEPDQMHAYLSKRRREGVRVNLNHLGEAVLGEHEARRRMDTYLEDLKDPAVEYISVKISTLYSQIHPLAFDHAVDRLCDRLATLYRSAKAHYVLVVDLAINFERVPVFAHYFRRASVAVWNPALLLLEPSACCTWWLGFEPYARLF